MRVRDLLERDLTRPIEEIIKVDQEDEGVVFTEITEYIATQRIRDQYYRVLRAIADGKSEPTEGVGVWVSGFFGSGKSSFAKILGYVLGNRTVMGRTAGELFSRQVNDERISDLVEFINAAIPTEVVMFDIAGVKDVRQSTERVSELMYKNLLRTLDYSEDFEIAELEIDLESEGRLAQFVELCESQYGRPWRIVRKTARKFNQASAILHEMDPATYPSPDSWDQSTRGRPVEVTVDTFIKRVFDLVARRRPGKAVAFVIDEVGQYVAKSEDKIEDLRVVAEKLGRESRNRVSAGTAPASAWLIVTSQEKLEEVVAAIDSKRVQLAKLTDRFKHRIDLSPADIREVATRRVLSKRPEAEPILEKLFSENQGLLTTACQLERTTRWRTLKRDEFVHFYPYLPHFIELSIDIVSGIRLSPGAPQHHGGSNRTIIKQAYEMLASKRTAVGDRPIGALVSADLIFDLVEGNLPTEIQKDVSDIAARFANVQEAGEWQLRVAKTICLLEYVHDLPRTVRNIASLLVDQVGEAAPVEHVERALNALAEAQFVRHTEEGWKLQTAQEKHWVTERSGFLQPKPRDRNEIRRESVAAIFDDPRMRAVQPPGLRTLKVGVSIDDMRLGDEGHVMVNLVSAEDETELAARLEEVRTTSRNGDGRNRIHWVFAMNAELDHLVAQVHASRQMMSKYEQLRARGSATAEERTCLQAEVAEEARHRNRLRDKLGEALAGGSGIFRGVTHDASSLGKAVSEILRALACMAVPELYPKLAMGSCPLGGDEAELALSSGDLSGLPHVFHDGQGGLSLVVKSGNRYVPNPSAPIAAEVLGFIDARASYGETVTGKAIEEHFSGFGYGWDKDVMKMVLAVLLRAGAIEITYQGRRYIDSTDRGCRAPFASQSAFRAATFALRRLVGLAVLKRAVENYESLTGDDVSMEEAAVSAAFKELCEADRQRLMRVQALVDANGLSGAEFVREHASRLTEVLRMESDQVVQCLAAEGDTFRAARESVAIMDKALTEPNPVIIRKARTVLDEMWPALELRGIDGELSDSASWLQMVLYSDKLYGSVPEVARRSAEIEEAYGQLYMVKHSERAELYHTALASIKASPHWDDASEDGRTAAIAELSKRACAASDLATGSARCAQCNAGLAQIESDIPAVRSWESEALERLINLSMPESTAGAVKVVRAAECFAGYIESEHDIELAVSALRQLLRSALERGVRIRME